MAILFKSHNKVKRYQVGGTIPFYAKASYTPSFGVKYDPSALLTKYAKEDTEDDKKDKKDKQVKSAYDDLKPDGLDNDNQDITEQIAKNHEDIQYGLEHIDDFEKSRAYSELEKNSIRLSGLLEQNKAHKAEFKTNVGLMEANQGGDALVYQNGSFLVREPIMDEEGKMVDYKYSYKPAEELFNEKGQYNFEPLRAKDLAEARNSDIRLKNDYGAIVKLKDAIGVAKGVTEYLDPLLNDLGVTKRGGSTSIGGEVINGQVIKEYLSSGEHSTNRPQINTVLTTLKQNLDPKFVSALEAKAWTRSVKDNNVEGGYRRPNRAEVDKAVDDFLVSQVWKRLATEDISNTVRKVDLTATENLANTGNFSGTTIELGKFTPEVAGLGSPVNYTLEVPHSDGKKSTYYNFYGTNAANISGELKADLPWIKQTTELKGIAQVGKSYLMNGVKLNQNIKFGDAGDIALNQVMMPLQGSSAVVMVVPVSKRDGGVVKGAWVEKMQKELSDLQGRYKGQDINTVKAAKKDRDAIVLKYDKMLKGKVEMQLVVKTQMVFNQQAANYTMKNGTEEQKKTAKIMASSSYGGLGYGKTVAPTQGKLYLDGLKSTLAETGTYVAWNDFDKPGHLKVIDVFTPIGTFEEVSSAGKVNPYTAKENLSFGSISNNNAPSTWDASATGFLGK